MTVAADAPAGPGQMEFWTRDRLAERESGLPATSSVTGDVLCLGQGVDRDRLLSALVDLALRHETLRTTLRATDEGGLRQLVHSRLPMDVETVQLAADADADADFARAAERSMLRPFSLEDGPVWRVLLAGDGVVTHLALLLHHAVADGVSCELLLADLGDLYTGALGAGPHERQYRHATRLAAPAREAALAYWRAQLADAPPPSTFERLGDAPQRDHAGRDGDDGRRVAREFVAHLGEGCHSAVARVAAEHSTTPLSVYLAAYALTLSWAAGRQDVVFGLPTAGGRGETDFETVGPLGTVLPIRVRTGGPANGLVPLVSSTVAHNVAAGGVSLRGIVGAGIGAETRATEMPLFRTVAMQRTGRDETVSFAGVPSRRLWTTTPTAQYDVTVSFPISDRDDRIVVVYDDDRFDDRAAALIAASFSAALGLVLGTTHPAQADDTRADDSAWGVFARRASATTWRPAVVAGRDMLTYGELEVLATRLASGLTALGVRPGDQVGARLRRGPHMVALVLACARLGATYVPTDASWPPARIDRDLAGCALVVSRRDLPRAASVVELAPDQVIDAAGPDTVLPPAPSRHAPLALLFTSGSTGRPKGVLISHSSVLNLTDPAQPHAVRAHDRVAHHSNLAFDATTYEMWAALTAGATLDVVADQLPSPRQYADLFSRSTVACVATGLFAQLALDPECAAALSGLDVLTVGGGVLPPHAADAVYRPGAVQLNVYGPTECTTFTTTSPMTDRLADGALPLGVPLHDVRCHVLDSQLGQVPAGEGGDLYVSGAGLAVGYAGQPRTTAERFVPDPDPSRPGTRMYATGDRVRLLPDGGLEFLGRVDDQVKVRGFRVELGEAEAPYRGVLGVLGAYAGIDGAGVLRVVLHVEDGSDSTIVDRARAAAAHILPRHMIPATLLTVTSVPLTANGKVDRAQLLARPPVDGTANGPHEVATPAGDTLTRLLPIWVDVLGEHVHPDSDFFEAGGDSLRLIRLLSECRSRLGADLKPSLVYRHPTARRLAHAMDGYAR